MSANEEIFFEELTPEQPEDEDDDETHNQQQDEDETHNQQQGEQPDPEQLTEEIEMQELNSKIDLTAQEAWERLKANPEEFLKKYQVKVAGKNSASSGVQEFTFSRRDLSDRTAENTPIYQIQPKGENVTDGVHFSAHNLVVLKIGRPGIAEIPAYNLNSSPEVGLMITGQLSGCAFCFRDLGERGRLVAHIQPVDQRGADLQEQLVQNARFEDYPNEDDKPLIFGASMNYNSDTEKASVIGVRDDTGGWAFLIQVTIPPSRQGAPTKLKASFNIAERIETAEPPTEEAAEPPD